MAFSLALGVLMGPAVFAEGDIGGDDVTILESLNLFEMSMDIASNGDIYVVGEYEQANGLNGLAVFRSQDGGTTWDDWGEIVTPTGLWDYFNYPCLKVVEGDVDKCFIAYTHGSNLFNPRIMMASCDLTLATGDFSSPTTVMSTTGVPYTHPRFDTDADSFSDFFIYLVAQTGEPGSDIYFTRSTNFGATFVAPYQIGSLAPTDRRYQNPDVCYGFGGFVTVVWDFVIDDTTQDSALRYRRAENSAASGISDWSGIYGLGLTTDDIGYWNPKVEASATGSEVVIAFERRSSVKGGDSIIDTGIYISTDSGLTFPTTTTIPGGPLYLGDIEEQYGTGNWFIGGYVSGGIGIVQANVADLTSWSTFEFFSDHDYDINGYYVPDLALNPALDQRPAMLWGTYNLGSAENEFLIFDGAWRRDPGYPNLEPGFPVVLAAQSLSAPGLVDVNGDGDLEIVFGDQGQNIQIYQTDGTPLPGWPVDIGEGLSESPIAVGDLRGNGEMYIVAGSMSGRVHCYDSAGQVAEGDWPFGVVGTDPAYVAIGAFGQGPYPRGIVTGIGNQGRFLDHRGGIYPESTSWSLARLVTHPPAIGDVNGNGLPDAVFAHEEVITVTAIFSHSAVFGGYLEADISGAPTLGDLDLDGDFEVVVPLMNGVLHVFDGDGTEFPGFPFTSSTGSRLSTAAIAQCVYTQEPDIAVAARNYNVHLVLPSGIEAAGFPAGTGGWANYGSPIIGRVEGVSEDVVMGSRGKQAWAWGNYANVLPGWPLQADFNFYETPAMGDLDLDGSTEVVLLSTNQLMVVDINQVGSYAENTWQMAGHDHQRTGCADCPEDLVTPVEDDVDAITRVSFAPPWPNPSSGSATFHFAVPGPAVVNLEVFDIRGHRVSLVTREEVGMGRHVASWNGLADRGEPVASGVYFARLSVNGPGINEVQTRKVTLNR